LQQRDLRDLESLAGDPGLPGVDRRPWTGSGWFGCEGEAWPTVLARGAIPGTLTSLICCAGASGFGLIPEANAGTNGYPVLDPSTQVWTVLGDLARKGLSLHPGELSQDDPGAGTDFGRQVRSRACSGGRAGEFRGSASAPNAARPLAPPGVRVVVASSVSPLPRSLTRAASSSPLPRALTWLLRVGWRRHGALDPFPVPAPRSG
jgi:hypothetical protein